MSLTSFAVPRRRARPARPARVIAALAAIGIVVAAPVALIGPASAHDQLTKSVPAAGSTITTAPDRIRLTFTDQVKSLGLVILVKDPSGASVTDGAATIDGTAVIQPVSPLSTPGDYTVAYRVVSSDGHPINGRFTFTLDVPSPTPTASSSPSPSSPSPSESPTAASSSSASPAASETVVAAAPVSSTSDSGAGSAWLLAGVGLLVALVVTGVVLARRRSA